MLGGGVQVGVDYGMDYQWGDCFVVEYVVEFGGLVEDLVQVVIGEVDEYQFVYWVYVVGGGVDCGVDIVDF